MKTNALAVANYLVEYAKEQNKPLQLLGLMKRVYIVHGFSLAIYGKSALDSRFDTVEAWKYGPVIPSVYHSFKYNKEEPILKTTEVLECANNKPIFVTPILHDEDIKRVAEMVWNRYEGVSDKDMVELTHMPGTPWSIYYVEGANIPIPDKSTESYYKDLISSITKSKN